MRNFLQRIREGFQRFMIGRYGADQLSRFMIGLALVLVVINLFVRKYTPVLSILVWVIILLSYLRMFSRNIQKRYDENTRYLMLKEKVVNFFKSRRDAAAAGTGRRTAPGNQNMRSDAEHRIFRCPKCSQRVRVPRGKGRIEITCPRCGEKFVKRG